MKVTLQPSGAVLEIQAGERILDGARRLGYDCPQSCRNGNCHICAALLVEGLTSKLIGRHLGISPRTVDVYRARLMRKYEAATTPELVNRLLSR